MSDRLSSLSARVAFLLAAGLIFSTPAMAGFQWVAPNDMAPAPSSNFSQEALPMQPSVSSVAPASAGPEIISPLVITGSTLPPVQAPAPALVPLMPTAPASQMSVDNGVVVGFAKSIPLAVALRQVLPNGYAFSIDPDVDMGTLVSFQGGRPWRDTLHDLLAPAGLVAHDQGQMIAIGFAHMGPVPVVDAAPFVPYQTGREPKNMALVNIPQGNIAPMPMPIERPVAPVRVMPQVLGTMPAPMIERPMHEEGVAMTESWNAERGQSLRKILEDWCRKANVEFNWLSEYDYPLQASASISGNFEEAVRALLVGFEAAHPQPVAELHANSAMGQMVLVVRTRGNTNSD